MDVQQFQRSAISPRGMLRSAVFLLAAQLVLVATACAAREGEFTNDESPAQRAENEHPDHTSAMIEMMTPHQRHGGPHMRWTALRDPNAADAQRAEQIIQTLRQSIAKYKDYQMAFNDGFVPMHPERKPKHFHFANKERRLLARTHFDPAKPTSLLYRKSADGYELEGAMYTAPRDMTEEQLNERVPLSIAQWHAHVNFCVAPDGTGRRLHRRQFGFPGTITTESECQQAGGRFIPQLGGWMIHVYPFETTLEKIWTH